MHAKLKQASPNQNAGADSKEPSSFGNSWARSLIIARSLSTLRSNLNLHLPPTHLHPIKTLIIIIIICGIFEPDDKNILHFGPNTLSRDKGNIYNRSKVSMSIFSFLVIVFPRKSPTYYFGRRLQNLEENPNSSNSSETPGHVIISAAI